MASVIGYGPAGSRPAKFERSVGPKRAKGGDPLGRLVELEVIPRLLVAHSEPPFGAGLDARVETGSSTITPAEVERFAPLALSAQAHAVLAEVEAYLQRGVSVETIFVELLAPAARILGRGWEEDSLDFVEVTMGLWRLQEVLREIAARSPATSQPSAPPRNALFAPMPGEQHSFGTAMVTECFSRAGWETEILIEPTKSDLLRRLAQSNVNLVGLTVTCDSHIDRLRPLIAAIRNISLNPNVHVMIGGRVPTLNPTLAAYVGADASAPTAVTAIAAAERLVETRRCTAAA